MKRTLFLISLLIALTSCSKKESEIVAIPSDNNKIVNTKSSDFIPDELYVKFTHPLDEEELNNYLITGVKSIEKVFNSTKGKEELEARFGLDRWYILYLDESSDCQKIANEFALENKVSTVQFSNKFHQASDCVSYPAYPVTTPSYEIETKADVNVSKIFNDPLLIDQWHYINQGNASIATSARKGADINVKDVWTSCTTGDSSIIVAVVDAGVKYTHPDLIDNMWVNPNEIENGLDDDGNGLVDDIYGYNFVDNGPITWAKYGDNGHGTHVAGTIAAVNNNGKGVSGIAGGSGKKDGVKIMSCQIFSGTGGGNSYVITKAIKYAADNGASIISCSFGYDAGAYKSDKEYKKYQGIEYDVIQYFEACNNNPVLDGNIAIFATGNDSQPFAEYPGAMNNIISVSAFGPDYLPTYYTNYGPGCNITAPGGEAGLLPYTSYKAFVLSTLPSELNDGSDYGYMQGTSMATPHVSGVVALGLSYAKKLGKHFTTQKFKEMILASANDFETNLASGKKNYISSRAPLNLANYRKKMGTGSIDAWRLMMKIEGVPCLTAAEGKNQWLDLSEYFGTASKNLSYIEVTCDETTRANLGLKEDPYIKYGRLYIYPTKCGSGKFTVSAIGGGEELGGGDAIGGMFISQEVSVVVRSIVSSNGGWL